MDVSRRRGCIWAYFLVMIRPLTCNILGWLSWPFFSDIDVVLFSSVAVDVFFVPVLVAIGYRKHLCKRLVDIVILPLLG